ncbi:MAG: SDR family NAD(P)-dependent oxidoreductase [Pseudomonadota bacterium]
MSAPTALVTGGAQRLGRAMALALAGAGYGVVIHYNTSKAPAEELAKELCAGGGRSVAIGRDLSDAGAAGALVEEAREALGPLTLLINSASTYDSDTLASMSETSWAALNNVNVFAPVMLMQAFAAQAAGTFPKPGSGSIVNMLDVQLSSPSPQFFSYFCAKAALEAATRLAAVELAPAIRVNAIAPGLVLPSWGQTDAEFAARQRLMPLGEGLGAKDIVKAMLFLVETKHVTGHVIPVDSGQRLLGFGNADVTPTPF